MREMFKVKIDLKLNRSISNENYPKLSKGLGGGPHVLSMSHRNIALHVNPRNI